MYRIIIADDEPIMRKGLMTLVDWKALDCEIVFAASDGQAVIDALAQYKPDIAILDIKMPRKSGIDVACHIYEKKLPVKVILLTAYADFSYAQQAISYGVSEYVTKTGAMSGIVEAVEKCKAQLVQAQQTTVQNPEQVNLFLKSVLDGSLYDQNLILEKVSRYHLDFSQCYILSIDFVSIKPLNSTAENRIINNLESLLQSVFQLERICFIPMGKNRFCVVLFAPGGTIHHSCVQVAETFSNLTGHLVYIGISHTVYSVFELAAALKQADEALEERFFEQDKAVHSFMHKPAMDKVQNKEALSFVTGIASSVEMGNEKEAVSLLERLFLIQKNNNSNPEEVKKEGLMLLNLCKIQLGHLGATLSELADSNGDFYATIQNCRFHSEYCDVLRSLTIGCCRTIASTLQYSSDAVLMAQNYIEKNYHHPITQSEIAAAINVNPSYLSRIFKNRTGVNMMDAINRKKIKHARELLDVGQLKIYEVAAVVGIEDTAYFSHLFKKYMGVSPKAYQERTAPITAEEIL